MHASPRVDNPIISETEQHAEWMSFELESNKYINTQVGASTVKTSHRPENQLEGQNYKKQ